MEYFAALLFGVAVNIGLSVATGGGSRMADGTWWVTDLPILLTGFIYGDCERGTNLRFIMAAVFGATTAIGITIATKGQNTTIQCAEAAIIIMASGFFYAFAPKDDEKPKNDNMIDPA